MKDVHRLKADFDKKGKRKFTDGNKDLQDLWEEINQIPGDHFYKIYNILITVYILCKTDKTKTQTNFK